MNILVILAAISVAVYGETCKDEYSDEIKVCDTCHYLSRFADESDTLKDLVFPHGNDENYKLKAELSLNLT